MRKLSRAWTWGAQSPGSLYCVGVSQFLSPTELSEGLCPCRSRLVISRNMVGRQGRQGTYTSPGRPSEYPGSSPGQLQKAKVQPQHPFDSESGCLKRESFLGSHSHGKPEEPPRFKILIFQHRVHCVRFWRHSFSLLRPVHIWTPIFVVLKV